LALLLGMPTLVRDEMRPRVTLGSLDGACRACACGCEAAVPHTEVSDVQPQTSEYLSAATAPQRAVVSNTEALAGGPMAARRWRGDGRGAHSHMGTHGQLERWT
jgi:hypothetical protein